MKDKDILSTIDDLIAGCSYDHEFYYGYMKGSRARIVSDFMFIKKFITKNSRILDIGGVPPLMSALLNEDSYTDITVVDPNPETFERYFAKRNINSIKANILNDTIDEGYEKYDFIIVSEVVEHLTGDILSAIENILYHLKPNGHILITTPNMRSISGLAALIVNGSALAAKRVSSVRQQYEREGYYGHVREYTNKEIKDLFESFNMKHIESKYQLDYRVPRKVNSKIKFYIVYLIEFVLPTWRLFGKYIFKKIKN